MTQTANKVVKSTDGQKQFACQTDIFVGTATGNSTPIFLTAGSVSVQCSGDATSISALVERSTLDPAGVLSPGPNWCPVAAAITGNETTPAACYATYTETDAAWWRVNLGTNSGGTVGTTTSVSGVSGSAIQRV